MIGSVVTNSGSSSFPSNRSQALALLYTQNQNLKSKTPTEIAKIYISAYKEINSIINELDKDLK